MTMITKTALCAAAFCSLGLACSTPPPDPDDVPARGGSGGSGGSVQVERTGGSSGSGTGGNGAGTGGGGGSSAGTGGSTTPGTGGNSPGTGGAGTGGTVGAPDAGADMAPPVSTLPPGVMGHPNAAFDYPKYPGFTLALVEEFDTPLDLDKDPIWTWSDGGLDEGAVRFVKDAISFREGKMFLTATKATVPASQSFAEPLPNADSGEVLTKSVRSGELRTKFNNFRYGLYEVRFKPPTSNGNFISTMFAFRTPKFEQWREIDIEVTADRPNGIVTNLISADGVGKWNPGIEEPADRFPNGDGAQPLPGGFAHQGQFHTYAFEWLPDRITWFVDGVPIRVKKAGGGKPIPEKSAKIIMNLWIFAQAGGFGGDPTRNVYPMAAEYEWFRFYKWDNEKTYPCTDTPNCLPADDRNKSKNNPSDGLAP